MADRIAQTVVKMYLEPQVEPSFHPNSYGYWPGRSALDAVGICRERCWRMDWIIDLDIAKFFDTIPHSLVLRAVGRHTDLKWILLYTERWLKAPLQLGDGTLQVRDQGSPQGLRDLAHFGKPLHALRVRHVDAAGVPGGPIRAVLRRRGNPLS
ncbi:MAG: reverse transcriptase domain-containing protein [Candidatus Dormibacteraceae bacterium]